MANASVSQNQAPQAQTPVPAVPASPAPVQSQEKIKFQEWFSANHSKYHKLHVSNMHSVLQYLKFIEVPEPATHDQYAAGLKKGGYITEEEHQIKLKAKKAQAKAKAGGK
jgi:hypothetical protein